MSKYVGARTHASAVRVQHASRIAAGNASRLAAAGLVVFLTVGSGAVAQAGEAGARGAGVDAPVRPETAVGPESAAGPEGSARPETSVRPETGDGSTNIGGTIELSATSSDTDLVTRVVVTSDGEWTTTVQASAGAPGAARTHVDAAATAATVVVARKPVDPGRPLAPGRPEDAGHQEVVVCHDGRTITIDSNGLNGHGVDELCAKPDKDPTGDQNTGGQIPVPGGDQTVGGGADAGEGGEGGDQTVGGGADAGEGGDQTVGDDSAQDDGEGSDGTVGDSDETTAGETTGDETTGDETAGGETAGGETADDDTEGGPVDGNEDGGDVVVALPTEDDTIEPAPATGRPGAAKPGAARPGAARPGAAKPGKPVDEVKGEEAERPGGTAPAGKPRSGDRSATPAATPAEGTSSTVQTVAYPPAQRTGDEVLGAVEQPGRNRPAALVLPQTGAAEGLGGQAAAGLLMVLAGAMTLRGRRRNEA